jgi:aryl-alcohol dehydrogenase-like predicted oxidoreductase
MVMLKHEGLVEKIGVSIYNPDELATIMNRYPMDLIQAPFNVFDRRLEASGWLRLLKENQVEVHVRSIFLQGLLLMTPSAIPEKFNRWQDLWGRWFRWLHEHRVSPLEACLGVALNHECIDRVVIGVDNINQLNEIIQATRREIPELPTLLVDADAKLINPSMWSSL